jgi:hypothetical protein
MQSTIEMPWSVGMDYGMGVNLLNGDVVGQALDPGTPSTIPNAKGQDVNYVLEIVNSMEDLYSKLGISVEASGRYGVFNASGKMQYANESKFNTQATFLLARCKVINAFTQVKQAQITPTALDLFQKNPAGFRERYGDGFVRGILTGGEYCAIISVISRSKEEQTSVAASIKASYNSGLNKASGEVGIGGATKSSMSRSEINISTYQKGGVGEEQSFTSDPDLVMKRLKDFPTQVSRENAVPYEVQIVSYETLDLPETTRSTIGLEQIEALEDFSRLHLKLLSWQSTINVLQQHPNYFTNSPSRENLDRLSGNIQENIIRVRRQAARCSADPKQCDISAMSRVVKEFKMPEVERKTISLAAISVTAPTNANSYVKLKEYDIPNQKKFEVEVKLSTLILEEKSPGGARAIGLGISSNKSDRIIAIVRAITANGHILIATAEGSKQAYDSCPGDVIYFRITKQDDDVDLLFSQSGSYFKSVIKWKLNELGFASDDTYKVVLTGYSTESIPISGKFYDLIIT